MTFFNNRKEKYMDEENEIMNCASGEKSQIVLYQPDETLALEVKIDALRETVWLTQQQIADLFGTQRPAITKHLSNIFKSGELELKSVSSILEHTASDGKVYKTQFYNLDAIISVGYRVNSINATAFRKWATSVLKNYLIKGYSVNHQLVALQERVDKRFSDIESTLQRHEQQLDFFIRTSTPPAEMVFFNGEFFSARVALEQLVKTATRRAIIIDGYIDARTFDILGVRRPGVVGEIYTVGVGSGIRRLRDDYNRQEGVEPIEVFKWRKESHDRWLIIDDCLYHCGHSINALGGKMSAITQLGKSPDEVLAEVK